MVLSNSGQLLTERAKVSGQLPAVIAAEGGDQRTFAALNAQANRVAHAMKALDLAPGDRVGVLMSNGAAFAEFYYGLAKHGAASVFLNWRLTADELAFQLEDAGVTAVVYDLETLELASALMTRFPQLSWLHAGAEAAGAGKPLSPILESMPEHEPDLVAGCEDLAFIMYTSGTTGRPKGAMHTHGSTLAWSAASVATTELRLGDRGLVVSPMFHIAGLSALIHHVHRGVTSVVAKRFDAGEIWRWIALHRVDHGLVVPSMLSAMRQHPARETADHSGLRWLMVGAAPVPVSLIESFAEIGVDIHQVYGSTETHGGVCVLAPQFARSKAGSTGLPYFGLEVRVVNADNREVAPGEPGEVITRGPHLIKGYWGHAQTEAFRDGWFHTGDVAEMDADRFIYIRDRLKDMIISGGENIYPAEVEDILLRHPLVSQAAVFGQPSARWGEAPAAAVVLAPQAQGELSSIAEQLMAGCRSSLARYKHPKVIKFVDDLPRNAAGKVLKRVLRERFPGPAPE